MKKRIAIFFLCLHLFSLCATLALHAFMQYRSDRFFEKQISRGLYNLNDLTEIRIPANVPGITDWKDYVDMRGEVLFANGAYNYVKIKMTRTAIYLMCVPNYKTTQLCHENVIDARKFPDIPISKKEHVPFEKANNLSAFHYNGLSYCFLVPVLPVKPSLSSIDFLIVKSPVDAPSQPPEVC